MESRERSSERELSSSQDVVIREISSADISTASPGESTKPAEKKVHHSHPRSSLLPSSHHRSSLERHGQSSSSGGALDLQSLVARSGSSSISGITVPIRLDALSYLLNNAVLGACKTPQMPCYPPMYPGYPYPYPYGPCMGPPQCNMPYMNQFPTCQPGGMNFGSQPGAQPCQNPIPNFNQFLGGTISNPNQTMFAGIQPQMGMPLGTNQVNATPTAQDNKGNFQSNSSTWPQRVNEGFGSNQGNPFSSEKRSSSSPQRGFRDNQSEDSWSGKPQGGFNRGRGRGDFGGRSWQGNSNSRFGDRLWNTDSGGQRRRFGDSPDSGSSFKRGRWQDGRGRGGGNRDNWHQSNRQSFSPPWTKGGNSQDRFRSSEVEKVVAKTDEAKDDDWEMEYAGEPEAPKISEHSPGPSKTCDSPQTKETSEKSEDGSEDESEKEAPKSVTEEKEEDRESGADEKAEVNNKDPAEEPEDKSNEVTAEEEVIVEEVYTRLLPLDDNNGILVEVETKEQ